MSEVTTRIAAYATDRTPEKWVALRDWLAHHTYVTPQRYEPGTSRVDGEFCQLQLGSERVQNTSGVLHDARAGASCVSARARRA